MAKVMMTIQSSGKAPTVQSVKERYGLTDDEIDPQFGVVAVDPDAELYTVLVEDQAAPKLGSQADWSVKGPYSNPRIEPFGPPEASDKTQ